MRRAGFVGRQSAGQPICQGKGSLGSMKEVDSQVALKLRGATCTSRGRTATDTRAFINQPDNVAPRICELGKLVDCFELWQHLLCRKWIPGVWPPPCGHLQLPWPPMLPQRGCFWSMCSSAALLSILDGETSHMGNATSFGAVVVR